MKKWELDLIKDFKAGATIDELAHKHRNRIMRCEVEQIIRDHINAPRKQSE